MPNEVLHRPGPQHGGGVGLPRVLSRWFEPDQVRNADRFYTVVFVLAVVVVGTAANVWPMGVPSALLFPVVVRRRGRPGRARAARRCTP